ncbi:hypothetical protein Acr_04g0002300 [Actinidia rufa]|uniref:Integrase catalytic domain-containing protein n=1 Tax=Actinidia rufa TaxID=165716 RepID=A0A7J0EGU8_9ERIC|nr:hypothetical protein Acr_04g0002300 [Actinidia rufa]
MHLRSRNLPRPSASSPPGNRSHPMANPGQAPDLEGLHREIHDMAKQMRIMNENNGRLMQLLTTANPQLSAAPSVPDVERSRQSNRSGDRSHNVSTERARGRHRASSPSLRERSSSSESSQTRARARRGKSPHRGDQIEARNKSTSKTDPMDHLDSYKSLMSLQGCSDEVMCRAFSVTLKGLARGYLRKYVAARPLPNSPKRRYGDNRPTAGDIQTIHGGFGSGGYSTSSRKRHAKSAHRPAEEEIYNLSSSFVADQTPITFSNDDLRGLHLPHDDALVVSAVIANFNVQRILIDNGSSADILFISAFEIMKIGNQGDHLDLSPETKVPHPNGDRRNQGRSKGCQAMLHFGHEGRDPFKSVGPIAITDRGRRYGEVVPISIHPDYPDRHIMIGTELTSELRFALIHFLKENSDVFAWSQRDVPGIDPEIAMHKLFTDPKYSPVCQKRRKFAPERLKVIEDEVNKLIRANVVREAHYSDWLANVVVAPQKEESGGSIWHPASPSDDVESLQMHLRSVVREIFRISDHQAWNRGKPRSNQSPNRDELAQKYIREVQQLTGRVATLNRFVSKSADKCLPFFKILRKSQTFQWNEESENAFQQLKEYLGSPPLLTVPTTGEDLYVYLSISPTVVSAVLIREEDQVQRPIYYVSKVLMGAEARYPKIEKLAYALMIAAKKLRHYFQAHPIIVLTDQPLKHILQRPDTSGRLLKWSIELSEFHIEYRPRMAIKAQALADFIVESTHEDAPQPETDPPETEIPKEPTPEKDLAHWILFVDGSSNQHGYGAGLVIQTPSGEQMEYAIRMRFKATNNEAEYEALLAGLRVAVELGAQSLDWARCIPLEFLASPSIGVADQILQTEENPTWMDEIIAYLQRGILPKDKLQARRPLLRCLRPEEAEYALREIHEGICGNHSRARSLARKTIRQGYFWPTIERDAAAYTRRCDKCQRFGIPKVIISDNARQFDNDKFRLFCSDLAISHHFSSPGHPQANGQVEVTNRTILRNLKARLERSKSEWAEDLLSILWAYHTTSRIPTGETPYSMVFGTESVIPVEIGLPSFRTSNFDKESNEVELRLNLDLLEERREKAELCQAAYKCQVVKYYNQRVKHRSFLPGDLVLRRVTLSTKEPNAGKLGPTWEGPYKVVKVSRPGTYWLEDPNGKALLHPWNAEHLKKYY